MGGPPSIRFEKTFHDFGEIKSDQKVEFDWVFRNEGGAPLQILGTRTSCGCTLTLVENDVIPPGGTGSIRMTFDPAGQNGSVRKNLSVNSNDPSRPAVRLTMRAKVLAVEVPREPGSHPPTSGQSLLMGECASCHAAPAEGKTGAELYNAVCGMCHGAQAEGQLAPSLRNPSYLNARSDDELAEGIAYGTANPNMPGFSELMGGPLSEAQIRSLVELLRSWGPSEGAAVGSPSSGGSE